MWTWTDLPLGLSASSPQLNSFSSSSSISTGREAAVDFAFPLRPAGILGEDLGANMAAGYFKSPALVHVQLIAGGPPRSGQLLPRTKWLMIRTPRLAAPEIYATSSDPLLPDHLRRNELSNHAIKSTIFSRSRHLNIFALSLSRFSVTPNKRNAVGIICWEMSLLDSSEKENRAPYVVIQTSRSLMTNISSARWRS